MIDAWLLFLAKNSCELVRYHDVKSMIGFSTILCVSDKLFLAICAYLQGSVSYFFIRRMTLWQEFMMHHAIAFEENNEQNLHIFRSWLFWTLLMG